MVLALEGVLECKVTHSQDCPEMKGKVPLDSSLEETQVVFVSISGVCLENFPRCKELLIPPGTQNYIVRMRLYDVNKRQMNITIRIVCRAEGSLKIFISAPYWLINKTGKVSIVFYNPSEGGFLDSKMCLLLYRGLSHPWIHLSTDWVYNPLACTPSKSEDGSSPFTSRRFSELNRGHRPPQLLPVSD